MNSPFDAVDVWKKSAPEPRKRSKVGLVCPECGEPVIRSTGTVQQTVHWDGTIIRRRTCSQGHHFESTERVTKGRYKEFQAGWRQENSERISEYNRKYRGGKEKQESKRKEQA